MKEKIQEFLIGLIVIWIIFILINVSTTLGAHTTIISAGGLVIGVSIVIIVALRFVGRYSETVRPAPVPETNHTVALKSQLENRSEDVSIHRALAREYLVKGTNIVESVLGNQGVGLGYYEKAEKELLKVLELVPNDTKALLDLAGTHVRLNKNRRAEQEFLRAIEIEPQKVEFKIVYARFLNNIKENYYEAENVLNGALAQPHSAELDALIHYSLHYVYARSGNYGKKSQRAAYKQNSESEFRKIFPEYNSEKFSIDFIKDNDVAGWSAGVLNGKIALWEVGPHQKYNRTYSKIIEVKFL
jgi:tetratricopeptide (TPR) repeat protein